MIQAIAIRSCTGIIWNCVLNMNKSQGLTHGGTGGKRGMSSNGKPRGRGSWNFSYFS